MELLTNLITLPILSRIQTIFVLIDVRQLSVLYVYKIFSTLIIGTARAKYLTRNSVFYYRNHKLTGLSIRTFLARCQTPSQFFECASVYNMSPYNLYWCEAAWRKRIDKNTFLNSEQHYMHRYNTGTILFKIFF